MSPLELSSVRRQQTSKYTYRQAKSDEGARGFIVRRAKVGRREGVKLTGAQGGGVYY